MNRSRCPQCREKLGNFLYADACPGCHEPLKHNLVTQSAPKPKVANPRSWPVRNLVRFIRFVAIYP